MQDVTSYFGPCDVISIWHMLNGLADLWTIENDDLILLDIADAQHLRVWSGKFVSQQPLDITHSLEYLRYLYLRRTLAD